MKPKTILVVCGLLAAVWGLYALRIRLSLESDYRSRPWAYNRDPAAKLLVGRWAGTFVDPAGVTREIGLSIDLPVTEEQRDKAASRKHKQSVGSLQRNKQAFHGQATITSNAGQEIFRISGAVEKQDWHRFRFRFSPEDEKKRLHPDFTTVEAVGGGWQGDDLSMALRFMPFRPDGSSVSITSEGTVVDGQVVWKDDAPSPETPVRLRRVAAP